MTTRNWNLEWLNHNSQRAYPLAADATRKDSTETFQLPDDFIVGMGLSIHAGMSVDPANFCVKSFGVFETGVSIVIGYGTGATPTTVATALISRAVHTRNLAYRLGGVGDFVDTDGYIIINQFDSLDKQPPGMWNFTIDEMRLELDVIRPLIRGVSGIRVRNGSDISDRIVGDIILRAGTNMRITPIVVDGSDPVLVFDAIEGEGLNETCVCEGAETGSPIYTINDIQPTGDGNFSLLGSDCVEVEELLHGVRLKNPCSEPCCGCEEAETVTRALDLFGSQATTLEILLGSLESRVAQFESTVLGSKLGDRGCNTSS